MNMPFEPGDDPFDAPDISDVPVRDEPPVEAYEEVSNAEFPDSHGQCDDLPIPGRSDTPTKEPDPPSKSAGNHDPLAGEPDTVTANPGRLPAEEPWTAAMLMTAAITNGIASKQPKNRQKHTFSGRINNIEILEPIPEPRPMPDSLPPVSAFESEMLPESIRGYVMDVSQRMQAAPDYAAVVAICALSGVLGRKVLIRPKQHDDWTVTPTAWGAVIGGPSTMKSPSMAEMLRPVHSIEARAATEWKERIKLHKAEVEVAEIGNGLAKVAAKKMIQDGRKEEAIMYLAASECGEEEPTLQRVIVNDASVEALGERMQENPNGLLMVRDELSGWISTLMQEDRQPDRAFFLEAFNGNSSFTYDRIGRGTVRIENCTLSVIGGIQPSKIAPLVRGAVRGTADDGLIQRLQLAVWPDPIKSWQWVDRAPDPQSHARYCDAFDRLHALELPVEEEGSACLRFSTDAQAMFIEWMEEIQTAARGDDMPEAMQSHLLKMPKTVSGLALLFELLDGGTESVGKVATARALDWADYLRTHANRLYSATTHGGIEGARLILKRKAKLPNPVKAREIHRRGWSGLSTPEEVASALEVLIDYGHLMELEVDSAVTGGRPTKAYRWIGEVGNDGQMA